MLVDRKLTGYLRKKLESQIERISTRQEARLLTTSPT